jgi:hypothetical protein
MPAAEKIIKEFIVIKYALLSGKVTRQLLEVSTSDGIAGRYAYGPHHSQYVIGRDCFEKWEHAKPALEAAKAKKIASLKKQIAKLEATHFEEPE